MPQPRKLPQPPPDADTSAIGARIKRARQRCGLSQAELAKKVGLARATITAYEAGRIRLLDDMVARIAKALAISADELLGLKIDKKNSSDESISIRFTKRIRELERLPEQKRKAILKTLDDLIKANS